MKLKSHHAERLVNQFVGAKVKLFNFYDAKGRAVQSLSRSDDPRHNCHDWRLFLTRFLHGRKVVDKLGDLAWKT